MQQHRTAFWIVGAFAAVGASAAACALSFGCSDRAGDCSLNGNCGGGSGTSASSQQGGAGPSSASTSSGSTSTSGGGGSGGAPPACPGTTPVEAPLDETCAVFVKAGAHVGGNGTREMPLASIADGIVQANKAGLRVYACGTFVEDVAVSVPFDLWGGFDCSVTKWTWDQGTQTALSVPQGEVPIRADGDGIARVHNFDITSPDPPEAMAGASSVGILFGVKADATVDHCTIQTGDGIPGANGAPPHLALDALAGTAPTDAGCTSVQGAGATVLCPGAVLIAGNGGRGGVSLGEVGSVGINGTVNGMKVTGGGSGDGGSGCGDGANGADGAPVGDGSAGAQNDLVFDLMPPNPPSTPFPYVTGGDGVVGQAGNPGDPGSGGGGAKAAKTGTCFEGGPGSAGSTGSCGGYGGNFGQAGGSSLGIGCAGTKLVLTSVNITTGAGQAGGFATQGTPGGKKATPYLGLAGHGPKPGCNGGTGGAGSPGGNGGGGRGGHSVDVAFLATPTLYTADAKTMFTHSTIPAVGGTAATVSLQGAGGLLENCWDFAAGKTCTMTKSK